MEIRDAVVIITGASGGIGLATARARAGAGAGARVALVARSADALNQLADDLRAEGRDALALPADVTDRAAVDRVVNEVDRRCGRIDILVNNAGQSAVGPVAEVDPDDVRKIVELNIFGPLYMIQAVVPRMRARGGGLIVDVSSMVTRMTIPGIGAYTATKQALNALSDAARVELEPDNIRVVSVFPGRTATAFGQNALGDPTARPQGRPGAPPDSAEKVAGKTLEAIRDEPPEKYMDDGATSR